MKKALATLAIAALGVLGAAGPAAAPAQPIANASRTAVCMESLWGGCSVRPHSVPYGAHASIYGIRWHRWGTNRAIGYGHILWRRTVSEPHFGPYAAKLVVSEPAECERGTWYSRRTLKIGHGFRRTLERNEPFGPCYQ